MGTPINIGIGGTGTINTSGTYEVTLNLLGTLDVTGPGVVANLDLISGLAVSTFNVSNGATAQFTGPINLALGSNFNIGSAGTLEFGSALSVDISLLSSINFTGTGFAAGQGGALKLDAGLNLSLLPPSISGFGNAANSIDFSGVANQAVFTPGVGNTGTLNLFNNGTLVKSFGLTNLPPGTTSANFNLAADGSGGTIVGFTCFVRGTRIATPTGERAVEDLAVGDLVDTLSGEPAPVKWIGRRKFKTADLTRPEEGLPIRIRAGALAPEVPASDLLVSPAHCMYLEGSLIPAQFLVNGTTIVQDFDVDAFEYFHIELDTHAVIFAEGAPTESYLDTGNRSFFANPGVVQLFPDFAPQTWDDACAPFITEGPVLLAAKQKLLARAEALGYTTTDEPLLHLCIDGRDVGPVARQNGIYTFALPRDFTEVRVVSRSSIAAEVQAAMADDRRRLGVAISRIVLGGTAGRYEIALDRPDLELGFHECERHAGIMWRWTDGDAQVPLAAMCVDRRPTSIEIHVQGTLPYRIERATSAPVLRLVA